MAFGPLLPFVRFHFAAMRPVKGDIRCICKDGRQPDPGNADNVDTRGRTGFKLLERI
ncbi:hypothetical protein LAB1_21930 [Roseibium sp. LAB1]